MAKIVDRDLGIVTAVTFDPEMKYVFAGNGVGGLCKISLDSYKIEYNQNQTGRTQSIVCSKNGKYIAAGSGDGSVAIFDSEKDWYLQTPVFLKKQKCDDTSPRVNVMTFSPDEKYILVGYLDGTVLKWPISTEVLSSFVSDTLNSREKKLNTTLWNKYIKKELTKKYFGEEINPEILEKYK
ncbi:MAG: WD40 repeat domain-containing protein [Bacteroidetes bacterium]|nr:WD40 repeat domain-containing protein [Bacteroidota bacterium]